MPPLNQEHAFIERSGDIFVVEVTKGNLGPDNDISRTVDTHYLEGLAGALKVADAAFDDNPLFWYSSTGMVILEEPHDDGESYVRVSVRSVGLFTDHSP